MKGVRANLKSVVAEKRISPKQFEKFQEWALRRGKGDLEFNAIPLKHYRGFLKGIDTKNIREKKDRL